MTSCVFSLFFLVSLCSSITADDPTGIKVRITDKGLDALKDVGVALLNQLDGKTFVDFPLQLGAFTGNIKELKFKFPEVTSDQFVLSFQKDSGLQLEIKDLTFFGELERNFNVDFFTKMSLGSGQTAFAGGMSAKIGVKLNRDQGHLTVQIPNCEFKTDKIKLRSNGKLGLPVDSLQLLFEYPFNKQICPAFKILAVPKVNSKLKDLTMKIKPFENFDINIDYSLSGDVAVTSSSLDVPFKSLVSRPDEAANAGLAGKDPVFTESENNQMAYVGASEAFFNSFAQSLYSTGAMKKTAQVTNLYANIFLKALQVIRQPWKLMSPLSGEVEVTEVPSISISKKDGVTLKITASGRVSPEPPAKDLISGTVTATCKVGIKEAAIEGGYLTFPSEAVSCTDTGGTIKGKIVNVVTSALTSIVKIFWPALRIPLTEGVSFIQAKIDYHDGFLVVGGGLSLTPAAKEMLVDALIKLMPLNH